MNKEYIERNLRGYEGDELIHQEIAKLVKREKINLIIETGTYLGGTTRRLCSFAPVISVEIDPNNFKQALKNLVGCNADVKLNSSVGQLKMVLPTVKNKNILFFLDAHWQSYCPLLDELQVIADNGIKPVIVIHDFKVPGKDFGYDSYKGQDFEFSWIKEKIEKIYGNNYTFYYNQEAEGAKRGVIYIYELKRRKKAGN